VLAVVYLIYNEGYDGRRELAAQGLRLGSSLAELMPDEPEVHGLLALMLLNDSRRAARLRDGELVLLAEQDRTLWDWPQIEAGRASLERARALRGPGAGGVYALQAAIASLHAAQSSDWPRIAALYGELVELTDSPVVELNRAVALAEADGVESGLAATEGLALDSYPYLHATRADFLRRLGRPAEARVAYGRALELVHSDHERRFLQRRLAELGDERDGAR
jgi:RNA polymerase sigma-70 factor (ECF subfamily)